MTKHLVLELEEFLTVNYLLKTEPSDYSFADLERDQVVLWEGVSSPAAVKNLREMTPGDHLVIYETGNRKCVVGTAAVISVDASDPKSPSVKIRAGKALANPISLAEIKKNSRFANSPLVRQGRLSVVPLTDAQFKILTSD